MQPCYGASACTCARNAYLNPAERSAATILYRSLSTARDVYLAGERNGDRLRKTMQDVLQTEPSARPQYVSCADPHTLQELSSVTRGALLSLAVFIGKTRLIDNILLESDRKSTDVADN